LITIKNIIVIQASPLQSVHFDIHKSKTNSKIEIQVMGKNLFI